MTIRVLEMPSDEDRAKLLAFAAEHDYDFYLQPGGPDSAHPLHPADSVAYDSENEVVTAAGQVRMSREGTFVAADQVRWDRRSGEVVATGNVVVVPPEGDRLISERVVLTDSLRDATLDARPGGAGERVGVGERDPGARGPHRRDPRAGPARLSLLARDTARTRRTPARRRRPRCGGRPGSRRRRQRG